MVKWPKFRSKISDLGILGLPPQKVEICPGLICTIMQNFTPIDASVAEISVTGQIEKTATKILFHTDVWQVIIFFVSELRVRSRWQTCTLIFIGVNWVSVTAI